MGTHIHIASIESKTNFKNINEQNVRYQHFNTVLPVPRRRGKY